MRCVFKLGILKSLESWRWLQRAWDAARTLLDAFVASYVLISLPFLFSVPPRVHRDWGNRKPNWGCVSLCGGSDCHPRAGCVGIPLGILPLPSTLTPPAPLHCKPATNTAPRDLKYKSNGRMAMSLAEMQVSEHTSYSFLNWALSDLWGPTEDFAWATNRQMNVVRSFFFKRRKKNFSKRQKEHFYETANSKQCLHQVSWKNIAKTDYLHESSSYVQQLKT